MNDEKRNKIKAFANELIDEGKAVIAVPPQKNSSGYWFGGGNMIEGKDGTLYITGRYRNYGDSRTGTGMGERGLELAIFASKDRGSSFSKIHSFSKKDLGVDGYDVLSIEGTALYDNGKEIELYISTEKKNRPFPEGFESFHKPGTGSWTIDRMTGPTVEELDPSSLENILENSDPRWFNEKDPFVHTKRNGDMILGFCTHPFNWASSNSAYCIRKKGEKEFSEPVYDWFPRGYCWDVGITRATSFLSLPGSNETLVFYDGGESMRNFPQHENAKKRPRGYSCEELGGLAYFQEDSPETVERISIVLPSFVSSSGTGCLRYVHVLETDDGYYATWQQSMNNLSQPLMLRFLPKDEAERILLS